LRSPFEQNALRKRETRYAFAFEIAQKCVYLDADEFTDATEEAATRGVAALCGARAVREATAI
jgi:hypothetical protein